MGFVLFSNLLASFCCRSPQQYLRSCQIHFSGGYSGATLSLFFYYQSYFSLRMNLPLPALSGSYLSVETQAEFNIWSSQ